MSTEPVPQSQLRAGHSERDAVADLLQAAAGDGRLSLEELDQRLGIALQARTYGDLEPLIADLGVEPPWRTGPGSVVVASPGTHPRAGFTREDPLRLDGGWSSEKRTGAWVVPPFIRLNPGMGSVRIDCLRAQAAAPVIEIEVIGSAGSALFIVPEGWAADGDRLGKSMGTKTLKVSREPARGMPLLLFFGEVGLGTLKVRPPSPRELRRAFGEPA